MNQNKPGSATTLTPWRSEVLAITGTIGSGKSTFMKMLKERGVFTVSADDLAREVVAPGTAGLAEVQKAFGKGVLNADGTLDRAAMGREIFSRPDQRKRLEAILHPKIAARASELFRDALARGEKKLAYEIPLLFETGLNSAGFKKIIVITANDPICVARIMKRNGLDRSEAEARIHAQWPVEKKKQGADIIIDNSGSEHDLAVQVEKLFPSS